MHWKQYCKQHQLRFQKLQLRYVFPSGATWLLLGTIMCIVRVISCIFRPIGFLENMSLMSNHLRSRKIQFLRTLLILIWETCSIWKTQSPFPSASNHHLPWPVPAFKTASSWAFSSSLAFCKFSWACPGMVKIRWIRSDFPISQAAVTRCTKNEKGTD